MKNKLINFFTPGILTTLWVSFGSIISSIIAAIAVVLNSRLLTPEEFGIFSAKFALVLLLARIFDLGINLAIQRSISQSKDATSSNLLFQTGVVLKIISWIICLIFCLIFANILSTHLFPKITPNTIIFISFLVLLTLFYDYFISILQGIHQFTRVNIANISLSSIKLIGILILFFNNLLTGSSIFLVYGLTNSLISFFCISKLPFNQPIIKFYEFKKYTQQLLPIIKWTSMAVISAAIADNADILMIQKFLTNYETGLYASASRIALFINLLGMSLGTVASIRVAKYQNANQLTKYLKKAIFFAIFAPLTLTIISLTSPILIYLTSGPNYLEASTTLSILLIATGIDIAISPLVALYYLFNKPQFYFYLGLILTISLLSTNLILIPNFGINGSAFAKLITRILVSSFTIYFTYKTYKQHKFT